jgi:hypothetical protein
MARDPSYDVPFIRETFPKRGDARPGVEVSGAS